VQALFAAIGRPARILIASTLIAMLALGGFLAYRSASEPYAVLFAQLSTEDAAAVVVKLKELKVPHRVVDGGRVEVPEARVHALRLEIAGAGLPRGGGVGFESFDKMKLGATEFEHKVMFKRALEGELMRTVGSVSAVESARVHLVLPERSVFAQRRDPGSASVVVKLRPGREMGSQEIAAIVHLVASAVPGLAPERVALATTEGVLLRRPRNVSEGASDANLADDQLAEVRALESNLEERARTMLERVLGPGKVDVRVSAEMDFARVERTTDRFEPKSTTLRSEELVVEKVATQDDPVAGVPGAESNLPTGTAVEATELEDGSVVRHQHTRNFEVNRVSEKRVSRSGALKRLTVAVVVDGVPFTDGGGLVSLQPREPEELDRLAGLVRSAVGASEERNDLVTVESMVFAGSTAELAGPSAPEGAPSILPIPEKYRKYVPYAVAGLGALVLLSAALVIRRRRRAAAKLEAERAAEVAKAKAESEATAALEAVEEPPLLSAREEALQRAADDPATAALVLKAWLGTAGDQAAPPRAA
jgi:flagellar M-ring protein FliF